MLEISDLVVRYGGIEALHGVSLSVREGELLALLGANGAGKSTILRAVSGLVAPRSGRIAFEGGDIGGASPFAIVARGLLHVPEGRQVFGRLSVAENLLLGAYRRKDRERIERDRERVFSLFPVLGERTRQAAGTLSGGEQQMLAIGRALMGAPRLLLLDEPSLGLSPLLTESIFEVVKRLRREGITIVLVEQNAYRALEIADRAYVLETGLVKLSGTSAEMLANEEVKAAYLGE
jgi:branched-chain amino acid transport system ATP-binding protein